MRFIYLITCLLDKKVYVGQTKNPELRWRAHVNRSRYKTNHPLYEAMRLYGPVNFSFEVVETCEADVVDQHEVEWIERLSAADPSVGYNRYRGRLVFHCHTESSRKKIREAMKSRVFTQQHRQRLSEASRGKKHTLESKVKMSISKTGKIPHGLPELQAKRWSGEGNPRANITNEKAMEIRQYREGNPDCSIASVSRHFNVSYKTVYNLLKGLTFTLLEAGT